MTQGEERRDRRQIRKMQCVRPSTPLTTALGLLLETGVTSLPVTDEVLSCPALHYCLRQSSLDNIMLLTCN